MIRLEYYEFEVAHKPGKDNIVADMLSRIPSIDETNTNPNDDYFDIVVANLTETRSKNQKEKCSALSKSELVSGDNTSDMRESLSAEAASDDQEARDSVQAVEGEVHDEIMAKQSKDENLRWLKNLILEGSNPNSEANLNAVQNKLVKEFDNFKVKNNTIYRSSKEKTCEILQIVVRSYL